MPDLSFPTVDAASDSEDEYLITRNRRRERKPVVKQPATTAANGKKKKNVTVTEDGFAALGLSPTMCTMMKRAGYMQPTSVQSRAIPAVLGSRDAVIMARTGAGKTAAFLAPILDALMSDNTMGDGANGPKALVLAPTRELALQTYSFYRTYTKGVPNNSVRAAVLVGGTPLDAQFDALAVCPELLVATPGRCLQLVAEMGKAKGAALSLATAQTVVFDEADRLFEGTLAAETAAILRHLGPAPHRQTVLVSATMPSVLAEFSRTGLRSNAEVVRMDTHDALPEKLANAFISVRSGHEKDAALLVVLRAILQAGRSTLVFAATHRAVEYIQGLVCETLHVKVDAVHGHMDQGARVEAVARFRKRYCDILVVTDVAARGIDLPVLDVVLNYDFPDTPKVFVHRVGRAARAGREGWALSILGPDETPYLLDTHLHLGRCTTEADGSSVRDAWKSSENALKSSFVLGELPKSIIDEEVELVRKIVDDVDVEKLKTSAKNAHGLYMRTRAHASAHSVKRAKALWRDSSGARRKLSAHPWFAHLESKVETRACQLAAEVSHWKPRATILPVVAVPFKLRERKRRHDLLNSAEDELNGAQPNDGGDLAVSSARGTMDLSTAESKQAATEAAASTRTKTKKRRRQEVAEAERAKFFVPYQQKRVGFSNDAVDEEVNDGLGAFRAIQGAVMDLHADTNNDLLRNRNAGAHRGGKYWDRVAKKFVHADTASKSSKSKNIHVTSREARAKAAGALDYSLGDGVMYKRWLAKNDKTVARRREAIRDGEVPEASAPRTSANAGLGSNDFRKGAPGRRARVIAAGRAKTSSAGAEAGAGGELKTKEEIKRARKERRKAELRRMTKLERKKKRSGGISKKQTQFGARSSKVRVITRKK